MYKLPERRSEPRSRKGFDLNGQTPRSHQGKNIPFDEVRIQARDRYPLEEELERDREGGFNNNLNRKKPLPPKPARRDMSPRMKQDNSQ